MDDGIDFARIASLRGTGFYIADFITEDEEEFLIQKITSVPRPRWTYLSHRRLQTWPSALTKYNILFESPLPPGLISPIIQPRFDKLGIFVDSSHDAPNHVLINEYTPGQGIMPHEDGSAYYPLVATVSLGAPIVLDLYTKRKSQGQEGQDEEKKNGGRNFVFCRRDVVCWLLQANFIRTFCTGLRSRRERKGWGQSRCVIGTCWERNIGMRVGGSTGRRGLA